MVCEGPTIYSALKPHKRNLLRNSIASYLVRLLQPSANVDDIDANVHAASARKILTGTNRPYLADDTTFNILSVLIGA